MHRRSLIGLAATVAVAGCSELADLGGGGGVDATLEEETTAEFSAEAGDVYTVSVEVEEIDDHEEVDGSAVTVRISDPDGTPLEARSVADSDEFEIEIETDGDHSVAVNSGRAHVTVNPA